jgi:hypothetical protein
MAPPSVRHGGGGGRDALTMVAVIGATLLLLGGGTAAYFLTRSDPVDAASLCPRSGAAAVHAVLIDRSDPISPLQAARVRQVLDAAVFEAQPGTRLALYVAESDGVAALSPVLALCNPGRDANPLYQNPRLIRERYERDFKARLDAAVAALLAPSTRQTSPIMESLKAVCVDAFGAAPAGVPLRLTIVSDMLQHSQVASHYRERDFEALLRSPRLQALRADCRGADVDVVYLLRPTRTGQPGAQTRAHQSFWDRYLQLMNARPRRIEPI